MKRVFQADFRNAKFTDTKAAGAIKGACVRVGGREGNKETKKKRKGQKSLVAGGNVKETMHLLNATL